MSLYKYITCTTGASLPENSVQGGYDKGPSYHAKAVHRNLTIPGKCGVHLANPDGSLTQACIPYDGKEHYTANYEILTTRYAVKHVKCKQGVKLPDGAVEGGFDGVPYYHATGIVNGLRVPGKVAVRGGMLTIAYFPYGGKEHQRNDFEVLTIVDNSVSHIEYQLDKANILRTTPKAIVEQSVSNNTSINQSVTFEVNEEVTNEWSMEHRAGLKITAGTKIETKIPRLVKGEVSLSTEASYSFAWGQKGSIKDRYDMKFPVIAKAGKSVTFKAFVTEGEFEVPYTIHLNSGQTSSGVWKGTTTYNLEVKFEEK